LFSLNNIDDALPFVASIVLMVDYLVWPKYYRWYITLFGLNGIDGTLPCVASIVLMVHYLV